MAGTDAAVMLTLAGLTYRGFQDALPGEPHDLIVRQALRDGLDTLAPVRGEWELVWGPITSRVPLGVFDSNAMYVVRHRQARHRYVVAIRGTNPVASTDWLFGDLLVGTTVAWPFATDGAAISTSTALGLAMLQEMRARPLSTAARFAEASAVAVGHPLDQLIRAGRALVGGAADALGTQAASLETQLAKIITHWSLDLPGRDALRKQFQQAAKTVRVSSADLRRKPAPPETQWRRPRRAHVFVAAGGGECGAAGGDDHRPRQGRRARAGRGALAQGFTVVGGAGRALGRWTRGADPQPCLRRPDAGQRGVRQPDRQDARRGPPPLAQHQRSRHARLAGQRSPADSRPVRHPHRGRSRPCCPA